MARYLLDTTVLIDYLRGRHNIIKLLEELALQENELGICCINIAELYSGLSNEEQRKVESLVSVLTYFEISRDAAKMAGNHRFLFARKGITLTTADALVAATAIENNAILITANIKDYPMKQVQLMKQP